MTKRRKKITAHLQIPVNYVEGVQIRHSLQDLPNDVGSISFRVIPLVQYPVENVSSCGAARKHAEISADKLLNIPIKKTGLSTPQFTKGFT